MSTTPSPDPEAGMPLTRRQRRALERAQQAQREAAIGDLPAPAQPAVQARPVGTASPSDRSATGTPAPRTVSQPRPQPQPQSRPQLQPQAPGSSHDPRSEYMPAARADRPDRRDLPHGTGHGQDEVVPLLPHDRQGLALRCIVGQDGPHLGEEDDEEEAREEDGR